MIVVETTVKAYCVFVSQPPAPVDEPLPHEDVTHEEKPSQTLARPSLSAAHVVALATDDVSIEAQYVDRLARPVAVEAATLAQVESNEVPYDE